MADLKCRCRGWAGLERDRCQEPATQEDGLCNECRHDDGKSCEDCPGGCSAFQCAEMSPEDVKTLRAITETMGRFMS